MNIVVSVCFSLGIWTIACVLAALNLRVHKCVGTI